MITVKILTKEITVKILTKEQFDETFDYYPPYEMDHVETKEYLTDMYQQCLDELIKYGVTIYDLDEHKIHGDNPSEVGVWDSSDNKMKLIDISEFDSNKNISIVVSEMDGIVVLTRSILSSSVITLTKN